jgi:hypothetical protein
VNEAEYNYRNRRCVPHCEGIFNSKSTRIHQHEKTTNTPETIAKQATAGGCAWAHFATLPLFTALIFFIIAYVFDAIMPSQVI